MKSYCCCLTGDDDGEGEEEDDNTSNEEKEDDDDDVKDGFLRAEGPGATAGEAARRFIRVFSRVSQKFGLRDASVAPVGWISGAQFRVESTLPVRPPGDRLPRAGEAVPRRPGEGAPPSDLNRLPDDPRETLSSSKE